MLKVKHHDNKIMNFSSIAPGVITGGNVSIGYRTAISLGSIIRNDIEIGSDNVIGASSYINSNITNKKVATKLCKAFLPISLNVLSANLHPTEEPKINKQ